MKEHKRDDCKVCSRSIARQSGVYCPFTSEIVASNVKGDAVDDGNVFLQRGGTRFISDRIVEPGDVASRREESTLLRVSFVQRALPRIIIYRVIGPLQANSRVLCFDRAFALFEESFLEIREIRDRLIKRDDISFGIPGVEFF